MANKKITDLQLIDAVTSDLNIPGDNGIASYRFTPQQMKDFILANQNILLGMLKNDIFTGLSAVTPADDDYFPLVDTSDSNKTKKGLVGTFVRSKYRAITSLPDTLTASDETVEISGASGTVTIPTAASVAGKRYKLVHAGTSLTQKYTIATTSSQTIGEYSSGDLKLCTKGEIYWIESNGTNWLLTGHYAKTKPVIAVNSFGGSTSAPTKATSPVTDVFMWARDGKWMNFVMEYRHSSATGAANGSGALQKPMPTGAQIDTNIHSTNGGSASNCFGSILGTGIQSNSSSAGGEASLGGHAIPYNADNIICVMVTNASAATTTRTRTVLAATGFTTSNYSLFFSGRVAISDWIE